MALSGRNQGVAARTKVDTTFVCGLVNVLPPFGTYASILDKSRDHRYQRFRGALHQTLFLQSHQTLKERQHSFERDCCCVKMSAIVDQLPGTLPHGLQPDIIYVDTVMSSGCHLGILVEETYVADPSCLTTDARAIIEIAWANRPFLSRPTTIDVGAMFPKLDSYVMVDYCCRRILVMRRSGRWAPELFRGQFPQNVAGFEFDVDWDSVYSSAGVTSTKESLLDVIRAWMRLPG